MEEERRCRNCGGTLFHKDAHVVFCPACFNKFRKWLRFADEKVRSHESVSIFNGMGIRKINFPGQMV